MMNHQNAINDIHALVANSEVSDAVAEKLLPIVYWLEAELRAGHGWLEEETDIHCESILQMPRKSSNRA